MTTANKITILRILLIPAFVVEVLYYIETGNEIHRLVAILCFAVASILDGVDGYVARRYHQWSELGTVLDPLADKLLLVSAIVLLSFPHPHRFEQIPLWLTGIIIGRDVVLGIGALVVRFVVGAITVRPRLTGKLATVATLPATSDATAIAWSSDGRLAYLEDDQDGHASIVAAGAAKPLALGPLLPAGSVVSGLAWSPDGTRFAFVATDANGIGEVYTVGADGTGLTRLTTDLGAVGNLGWR